MPYEDNKAVSRRSYEDVYNKENAEILDEIYHKDFIGHSPLGKIEGLQEVKNLIILLFNTFGNIFFRIEAQIAEGDKVVNQGTFSGIHEGEYMGISPTSKPIDVKFISIHRISEGKIIEDMGLVDNLTLLRQIGALSLKRHR